MIDIGEYWLDERGFQTFADGDVGDVNHEAVAYCAALGLPLPTDSYGDSDYDGPEFQVGERLVRYSEGDLGEDAYGNPIPITAQNCLYVWCKEHGAPASAIKYFGRGDGTADAREYAVKWMGWIRIKIHRVSSPDIEASIEIDLAKMDQRALDNLTRADFWGDEWEDSGMPLGAADCEVHLNITGGPRAKTGSGRGAGRQGSADDGKYYTFPASWLFQFKDAAALMRAVRNPQSVVAAAAEGEDPEANFSLKGLAGEVVDFPSNTKRIDWLLKKWYRVLATPGSKVWDTEHSHWVEIISPVQERFGSDMVKVRSWDIPAAEPFWIYAWLLSYEPGSPRGAKLYQFPGSRGGSSVKGLCGSTALPSQVEFVVDYNGLRHWRVRVQPSTPSVGPGVWDMIFLRDNGDVGSISVVLTQNLRQLANGHGYYIQNGIAKGVRLMIPDANERDRVLVWLDSMEEQGLSGLSGWPKQPAPWRPRSKMGRRAAVASVQKMLENEMDRLQTMAFSEPNPADAQEWIATAETLRNAWMAGDVEALYHLRGGRFVPTWEQLTMAFGQ